MARKPSKIMGAGTAAPSTKELVKECRLELKRLQSEAKALAKQIMAKHKELAKLEAKKG